MPNFWFWKETTEKKEQIFIWVMFAFREIVLYYQKSRRWKHGIVSLYFESVPYQAMIISKTFA